MSIDHHISAHEAAGRLVRYMPRSRGAPRRALYLAGEAQREMSDRNSAASILGRKPHIMAALERWVEGGRVFGRRRGEFLDRLKPPPPEIWEIRVTAPRPQIRLFGRFAGPDTLILTNFAARDLLADKGSKGWANAMADCRAGWERLFPGIPPFVGRTIHDYVTENCDGYPI